MANSMASASTARTPGKPPFLHRFTFSLDTYATGGVAIDALIAADATWAARKLPAASIVSGIPSLDHDAQGVTRVVEFDASTRKLILKNVAAGALAEQANGAIGATVAGELTVIVA